MRQLIISHRGNLNGINPEMENNPDYVNKTLKMGFDVEIDLWKIGFDLFLGHDKPQYKIDSDFLDRYEIWIHCKNIEVACWISKLKFNFFWHQDDDISITSKGYLWTSIGKQLTTKSIAVLPETSPEWDISKTWGICTDFPLNYKNGTL